MPLFAVYRIKKDFCGLEPRMDLTALMAIHLKFSGIRLTTAEASVVILYTACLKMLTEYYGQELKMDYINTMLLQKVLAC